MRAIIALTLVAGAIAMVARPAAADPPSSTRGGASPQPTVEASVSPSPSASPSPDFQEPRKPGFFDIIGRVRYAISQWFADLVTAALRPVFDLLGRTVFSTPGFNENARVVELWRFSLGIADAVLLLLVLAGAGIVTIGTGFASQMTAKEILPRLVLAAIASNVSLLLLGQMIGLSNALARAMLGTAVDPTQVSRQMITMLASAALGNPFLALFAIGVIVLGILVVIAYVIRIAAMVVLASAAPLMLIGHALPHTEGMARAWWRATFALLTAPILQSLLLAIAFRVFLSGGGVLGLPIGSGLIDLLVVACLLYLLYKVPFWTLNAALSGTGSRAWSQAKIAAKTAAKAVTAA